MTRLQWLPAAPRWCRLVSALTVAVAALLGAGAAGAAPDDALRLTPARVGYLEGDVAFWRPGAGDWEAATLNIPLAAGDALASRDGRFEVQIGPQAFLRGGEQTQLRLKSQEPDFLQLDLTQGSAVLDLRRLPAGHVIEIDTPQGAVTADRDGFYRVDVDADATRLTVRRAGSASLTPTGGQAMAVATGEAVSVRGGPATQYDLVAAPAFDEWDRWNYARADSFLAAPRAAAVAADVYGAAELERHGSWRYVETYGRVWVPYSVPVGWAPYSAGRWLWDPLYGWSWVDYAPWGWAPFHYGRWVYTGYWAWAPGPVVVTPVYAPALVAFFTPALSIGVGFGTPYVGWVALGWGEPLVPWWGGVGFAGVPCWSGWGGPRVVNNIVINTGDTVHSQHINMYRNADAPGGLVGVPKDHFGMPDTQRARLAHLTSKDVAPCTGLRPSRPPPSIGRPFPRVPCPTWRRRTRWYRRPPLPGATSPARRRPRADRPARPRRPRTPPNRCRTRACAPRVAPSPRRWRREPRARSRGRPTTPAPPRRCAASPSPRLVRSMPIGACATPSPPRRGRAPARRASNASNAPRRRSPRRLTRHRRRSRAARRSRVGRLGAAARDRRRRRPVPSPATTSARQRSTSPRRPRLRRCRAWAAPRRARAARAAGLPAVVRRLAAAGAPTSPADARPGRAAGSPR
ncbi:MAG: DUF6600 domain-containing protein [Candidatus Binatia bacterium]